MIRTGEKGKINWGRGCSLVQLSSQGKIVRKWVAKGLLFPLGERNGTTRETEIVTKGGGEGVEEEGGGEKNFFFVNLHLFVELLNRNLAPKSMSNLLMHYSKTPRKRFVLCAL